MRANEFITEYKTDPKLEDYEGLRFKIDVHDFYHQINVSAYPPKSNKEIGRVLFDILDHRQLEPLDLQVDEKFRGQGIAKIMYDYVKSKGYAIHRSWDQTEAGAKFWNKNRGEDVRVWEETTSANIVSAEKLWDYVSKIHPKDQQGGGFLKSLVMLNPQYELKRVPLSSLHIPNEEDDGNDPYGRAMHVDVDHAEEYSQYEVDKKPLVVDSQGYILDGAHRAWAASELLNKKDIMAYVPVKNRISTPQDLEIRKKFTNQNVAEGKVKLFTDPSYFGAEVDDTGFDNLPVVNISVDRLVGFEPDNKMNQTKSKANVEKIVTGLKQGAKLPPLLVRKYKNGYQVLDGHHRFWAYKLLGTKSIPSRIVPDKDIEEISKQSVAESVNDYLWHGSRYRNEVLVPRQANDTGGKEESNKNAIYATPSAKVAIAMGLTTPGSDTGMFPNDPQMVLFKGGIRKGEMVYLHKVPKDLFIKHNSREWYSKPDVKEITPIEVITVPVDKWLSLIRTATPKDLELQKKNMKKQDVAEGSNAGDIELSHSMSPDMLYVHATSDGTDVGGARFKKIDGAWTGDIVHVYPQFRRQGIATKIYDYAEDLVGKIIPSKTLKPKGKKFWDNRDKQGVAETFNQPYSLQWEVGEFGDYDAYTKLPDGSNLSIMFNKEDDDVYAIEFWRNNSQDATGDGDSQKVFATVLSAIQEFLTTKEQPRFISFTGAKGEDDEGKDSRVSLYSKLLQRYATSWGYKLKNIFDRNDAVVFDLVRIKQDVEEVVNKELWHPERMFKQRVPIGDYEFEARETIGGMGDYDANALTIIAYDPKKKNKIIGNANFVVKGRGSKRSLVSDDTYVDPKYRGEGIATMMYAYAKSLGNDVKGSNIQTPMGKKMWANWGSDAEHLKGNK